MTVHGRGQNRGGVGDRPKRGNLGRARPELALGGSGPVQPSRLAPGAVASAAALGTNRPGGWRPGAEPSGTAPGRLGAAVPPACPSPLFPASPSFPRCFPPRLVAPLGRGWGKLRNLPSNCFSSDKAETVTVLPLGRPWRPGRRGP